MEHSYIHEHNIIARYGMGKLSPEECARFEEHFVDCQECLAQLEATEDFRRALKTVAAKDAAQQDPIIQESWLAVFRWRPVLVAASVCAIIFAIPTFFLVRQLHQTRTELEQAKASVGPQIPNDGQQMASSEPGKPLTQPQPSSSSQSSHVTHPSATAPPSIGASGPPVPSAVNAPPELPVLAAAFTLETTRGGDQDGVEPVNHVVISRAPQTVLLSVDSEDLRGLDGLHATLTESGGKVLWQQDHVAPSVSSFTIKIPSNLLHEGDFLLTLEGRSREGNRNSRIYSFRLKFK